MRRTLALGSLMGALSAAGNAQELPHPGQRVEAGRGVVVAAHPAAAAAGLAVLQAGGNAVDAAVATAFAVGVAEPMMSGIGGGGSMTVWLQADQAAWSIDFYPAAGADPDSALDAVAAADRGAIAERWVGVPGTVAGLLDAQKRLGRLPRERVLDPAVRLAREGVRVHPMLGRVIREEGEKLMRDSLSAALFYPDGQPLATGAILQQPALAATLERIRDVGRDGFYVGSVAEEIVRVLSAGGNPLTLEDFAAFQPRWERPVCSGYRTYTVLGAAPPLSGVQVLQTLRLFEQQDPDAAAPPTTSPAALRALVFALRLARADRDHWLGDPRDGTVPATALVSPGYAVRRVADTSAIRGADTTDPGDPWADGDAQPSVRCRAVGAFAPATTRPKGLEGEPSFDIRGDGETTHLSVIDADGNAVALTFTIGGYFGYGVYAVGAFFNDAMENFGTAGPNARGPFRTPTSTTAPTILLDGDRVRLVVGSPGGPRITPAVVQTILYALDYGYDLWDAVSMPRLYVSATDPEISFEPGFPLETLVTLHDRGFVLLPRTAADYYFGGVHAILVRADGTLVGAADPRRDGAAVGY
jgi:gamma-glutamyltranspeptidase/glutathione hydrolase